MALKNGLLIADVSHQRLLPKKHGLRYTVYYLCFPLSQLAQIKNTFLSLERFNLFGFYQRDHAANCEDWIKKILADRQITEADGEVVLLR